MLQDWGLTSSFNLSTGSPLVAEALEREVLLQKPEPTSWARLATVSVSSGGGGGPILSNAPPQSSGGDGYGGGCCHGM